QLQITRQAQPTIQRKLVQSAANYAWQPIAKLYAICNQKSELTKDALTNVAAATGGQVHAKNGVLSKDNMIKGMQRAVQKAILKNATNPRAILEGKFFDNMSDILRGSIKFAGLPELRAGLHSLPRALQDQSLIVRACKNRFQAGSGYRDVLVNVSPRGLDLVFELQFHVQGMLDAKNDGGHAIYDELRVRKESLQFLIEKKLKVHQQADSDKVQDIEGAIEEQKAKIEVLEQKSAELYNTAFKGLVTDEYQDDPEQDPVVVALKQFDLHAQAPDKSQDILSTYRAVFHGETDDYKAYETDATRLIAKVVGEAHQLEDAVDSGDSREIEGTLVEHVSKRRHEKAGKKAAKKAQDMNLG
ncbi:MAG: hypothetical protein AAGC54_05510, partial [Cyanobacteria bacterium P01_F01_bin.4]